MHTLTGEVQGRNWLTNHPIPSASATARNNCCFLDGQKNILRTPVLTHNAICSDNLQHTTDRTVFNQFGNEGGSLSKNIVLISLLELTLIDMRMQLSLMSRIFKGNENLFELSRDIRSETHFSPTCDILCLCHITTLLLNNISTTKIL